MHVRMGGGTSQTAAGGVKRHPSNVTPVPVYTPRTHPTTSIAAGRNFARLSGKSSQAVSRRDARGEAVLSCACSILIVLLQPHSRGDRLANISVPLGPELNLFAPSAPASGSAPLVCTASTTPASATRPTIARPFHSRKTAFGSLSRPCNPANSVTAAPPAARPPPPCCRSSG